MSHGRKISVIGLGYVGLPVAVAFGKLGTVVAFDINKTRIEALKSGFDSTGEVSEADLKAADLRFSTDPESLKAADFHIVTVPTPVDDANVPDLSPLVSASRTVGDVLKAGDIVVYESTVYPGATQEICVPELEKASGLTCGKDFTVGYSPERINPGDKEHRFETITKVVAGQDVPTLEVVAAVYASVVKAGVHKAPSIATAEAAKVIENTQRDLNIALMNELSVLFSKMGLDTQDVLQAAGTKWNFLKFTPGLVGGHCIGVDPYYLTHKAEAIGYHPQVILSGRRINDAMGEHVARQIDGLLGGAKGKRVAVLGLTFKENVPDIRNTKVVDVITALKGLGADVVLHDPIADAAEVAHEYGLTLSPLDALQGADAVLLAVSHKTYTEKGWALVGELLGSKGGVVADIKGLLDRATKPANVTLWRL